MSHYEEIRQRNLKYPPPRLAFLKIPHIGTRDSQCLVDYIGACETPPSYLIFAEKKGVAPHYRGAKINGQSVVEWAAQYSRECVLVKLEDVAIDKIRRKEDKAFRRRDDANQGREVNPEDAVLTLEEFFLKDKLGSDTETVPTVSRVPNQLG